MEATATNVPHISGLDAFVTVNGCWFPKISVFAFSGNREHHNEKESAPQSISIVKQAHLPRNKPLASRKTELYERRADCLYIIHPACLYIMARP